MAGGEGSDKAEGDETQQSGDPAITSPTHEEEEEDANTPKEDDVDEGPSSTSSSSAPSTTNGTTPAVHYDPCDGPVSSTPPSSSPVTPPTSSFLEAHRTEVIRLILQTLNSLGHTESAKCLERESNVMLQTEAISAFRTGILNGDWEAVQAILPKLSIEDDVALSSVQYCIAKQKFLEKLEEGDAVEALTILREEITPHSTDSNQLHQLTCLLACPNKAALFRRTSWDGKGGKSRTKLLKTLHRYISSKLLLHEDRLCTLLEQSQQYQRDRCLYLNQKGSYHTLLQDYSCDERSLPQNTQLLLDHHHDEVWHVTFSPNGRYLASAGKDQMALLYDLQDLVSTGRVSGKPSPVELHGHTDTVVYVVFSPNNSHLLTCSGKRISSWSVPSGKHQRHFSKHSEQVTSCCWMPDSVHFFSAAADHLVLKHNINGQLLQSFHVARVNDLCVTPDASKLITVNSEKQIIVYDLSFTGNYNYSVSGPPRVHNLYSDDEDLRVYPRQKDDPVVYALQERDSLMAIELSSCGRYLLCNVCVKESTGCIHLYDLHQRKMVQKYKGHKQSKYVIRSVFGGAYENFILSGSEDARVTIYHRSSGQRLVTLAGHTKIVNSVSWNRVNPNVIASCSDDGTVRIWTTPLPEEDQL